MIDPDMLIARATKAHRLRCHRMGLEPPQPCCARSDVEENEGAIMVVLRNVDGTFATYQYQPEHDRLRWIDPGSLPMPKKSYHVVFEDSDTRIRESNDDKNRYKSFKEAKAAALEYLQCMIYSCEDTFNRIEKAKSYEQYQGKKSV